DYYCSSYAASSTWIF
nr:immunoglobulin light chain junction region [Macaca mulatta]MOW30510.1 immunoglobulin light chain junction region [Macaca mulatta]